MATRRVFVVFVLPVILSLIFGSAVLFDILQKPDRSLGIFPMSVSDGDSSRDTLIKIMGLASQYTTAQPVEIQVEILDPSFDCGDLYITVYPSGQNDIVTQGGFFEQCFGSGNKIIPIEDKFSRIIDMPGSYDLVVEMVSKQLVSTFAEGTFIVK